MRHNASYLTCETSCVMSYDRMLGILIHKPQQLDLWSLINWYLVRTSTKSLA